MTQGRRRTWNEAIMEKKSKKKATPARNSHGDTKEEEMRETARRHQMEVQVR